jgi:TRAP transporter 4TM/12TM fusion protein
MEAEGIMSNEEQKQEKGRGRFDTLRKPLRFLFYVFSAIGIFTSVGYIFGFLPLLDLSYYFVLMAMFLPMIFLMLPAHKNEKKPSWYSYGLAIITLGLTIFLATKGYSLIYSTWIPPNTWQLVVAIVLTLLLLEAARRAGGTIFLMLVLLFSLYPSIADKMPGMFWGPPSPLSRTIAFNIYSSDALLGIVTRVVGETLIGFLILAALLLATGAAEFFLKLAMALMGGVRGGAAKVAVVASGFFGSLSGSIFGNVVGTGSVTIPTMKRSGFKSYYAGALEACASTGGMMMPPVMGAVAFIMANFTNTEYRTIVIAAAIPSILYYFGLFCHVDSYAAKHGLTGLKEREIPSLKELIKEGWPFFIVLLFLIWGLLYMRWERLAPFYASAVLVILSPFNKRLRFTGKKVKEVLLETAKLLSQTIALLLPTSFILGGIMGTGVAPIISAELVRLGGNSVILVLAVGVGICLIFGMMGMIVAAYLMLALTFAPSLEQLAGLNTLAVHLFIAYYSLLAAITPPIALAAFIASGISGSSPILTSFHSARLGIVLFILPFFFLFQPALIFQGPLYLTIIWTAANVVAILLIAGGSEGYMYKFGLVRNWTRPILFVAGILVGFPEWKSTVIGIVIAIIIFAIPKWSRIAPPASRVPGFYEMGENVP